MPRTVHCVRLKREAEGLEFAPWPGELGRKIYENVSKEAWNQWLAHQTMLINENRLSPLDPKARALLAGEMEKFLFEGSSTPPPGYAPNP
jgi:Fe-S cluster biosynthesis and repair protein YggX